MTMTCMSPTSIKDFLFLTIYVLFFPAAAVDTLDDVEVTPAVSKSILSRVVQSRSDWCISRSPYLMLSSRKYQAVEKTI